LRRLTHGLLLVQLCKSLVERVLQLVGAGLFLLELFVEIAVVVLQETLGDSQLPDFLVLDDCLDGVFTALETEFEVRVSQRVFEL
jgi:hypothetical protein